jgi:antitoxin MazE
MVMQVSRWGNSLAIRLPSAVVEALELKEGDDIEVRVVGNRTFDVDKKATPEEWLQRMRRLRGLIPADFKFDREEANAR